MALLRSLALCVLLIRPTAAGPASDDATGREAQQDRARALACYATGRTLYEHGDLIGALRSYQRAWQWWPGDARGGAEPLTGAPLAGEIVPLAFSLGRVDEAMRYAPALPEPIADAPLLRRLALYAREQGRWSEAKRFYERWLAARGTDAGEFERLTTQLDIGRMALLSGDAPAASRAFDPVQQALVGGGATQGGRARLRAALGGSLAATWETLGRCHLEAERTQRAAEAFAELAKLPDAAPRAAYWLARLAIKNQQPLEAYELLQGCLDAGGDALGPLPYSLLADVSRRLNDPGGIVAEARRQSDNHPGSLHARLALAVALSDAGAGDQAAPEFAAVLRATLPPRNVLFANPRRRPSEWDAAALTHAARWTLAHLAARGQGDRFIELVDRLHADHRSLAGYQSSLESILSDDQPFADMLFMRITSTSTPPEIAPAALAELAVAGGRHELAGQAFRNAIDAQADRPAGAHRDVTLAWLQSLLVAERFDDAAAAVRWSIDHAVWPEGDGEPYFHLAGALALGDHADDADAAAQQAVAREPDVADFAQRAAWVLVQAERPADAIERYQRLIEAFDAQTDAATRAVLRDARLSLSYLTLQRGDAAGAAEWAMQVLDEFPNNPGALNDLGYLWADRGEHLHRALRMTERAVAAKPGSAAYWDSLGWVRFRLGRFDQALDAIDRALDLLSSAGVSPDGEILDHRGDVLAALGRIEDARASWRSSAAAYEAADPRSAAAVAAKADDAHKPPPP